MKVKQLFKTTGTYIRRTPYQAFAAILTMWVTLFIISIFGLLGFISNAVLEYLETRPQITAFLKDEADMAQVELLKSALDATGKVVESRYVSKEEALTIYQEQNKEDPLLLEMVTASILPASLEVSTTDIEFMSEISKVLEQNSFVEEVVFQKDIVDTLSRWTTNLRYAGIGVVAVFAFLSVLIILIIIGMKVAIRKEEIEVSGLVGATKGFIRLPFIAEGVFYGVLGAFLGWGSSYLVLLYATPVLVSFLEDIPVLPISIFFMLGMLGVEVLFGLLIGFLGSFLAVKRYLGR